MTPVLHTKPYDRQSPARVLFGAPAPHYLTEHLTRYPSFRTRPIWHKDRDPNGHVPSASSGRQQIIFLCNTSYKTNIRHSELMHWWKIGTQPSLIIIKRKKDENVHPPCEQYNTLVYIMWTVCPYRLPGTNYSTCYSNIGGSPNLEWLLKFQSVLYGMLFRKLQKFFVRLPCILIYETLLNP